MAQYTPPAPYSYASDKGPETLLVDRFGQPLLVREARRVGFRLVPDSYGEQLIEKGGPVSAEARDLLRESVE